MVQVLVAEDLVVLVGAVLVVEVHQEAGSCALTIKIIYITILLAYTKEGGLNTLTVPYNIQSHAAALAEGLSYGDKIHLGVCGNHVTEDAFFLNFYEQYRGIVVAMGSTSGTRLEPLLWGDIVELWPMEEKPNMYYSDVPEVADVLKKLKAGVQKHIENGNSVGVLYLLDQVIEAKKAEPLFKKVCEIVSSVRL